MLIYLIWCLAAQILFAAICYKYSCYRDRKISEFRSMIAELCDEYDNRHLQHDDFFLFRSAQDWFLNKYSYEEMFFSIKPLKLKYWYTKEELDKICN